MMILAAAIGGAPMVFAFIAGFFGGDIGLGWPVYIGWLILCLIVGGVVEFVRRAS